MLFRVIALLLRIRDDEFHIMQFLGWLVRNFISLGELVVYPVQQVLFLHVVYYLVIEVSRASRDAI